MDTDFPELEQPQKELHTHFLEMSFVAVECQHENREQEKRQEQFGAVNRKPCPCPCTFLIKIKLLTFTHSIGLLLHGDTGGSVTATGNDQSAIPRFLSQGAIYRAVTGESLRLPCHIENAGKKKTQNPWFD